MTAVIRAWRLLTPGRHSMPTILKKLGPIAVVLLVALAFFGYQTFQAKGDAPKVGDCVSVSGDATDAELDAADCGRDDVLFKVVSDDGKCDATENNYTIEVDGPLFTSSDAVDLCLFPEVAKGDCIDIGDEKTIESKVPCTQKQGTGAIVKVLKADYANGKATCPKRSFAMSNKKRGATLCLGANA
jgi:hypothetical protein